VVILIDYAGKAVRFYIDKLILPVFPVILTFVAFDNLTVEPPCKIPGVSVDIQDRFWILAGQGLVLDLDLLMYRICSMTLFPLRTSFEILRITATLLLWVLLFASALIGCFKTAQIAQGPDPVLSLKNYQ
jgi:hypothetical protein